MQTKPIILNCCCFQLGRCRSVSEFEKLNRIGEGTYGIVCKYSIDDLIIFGNVFYLTLKLLLDCFT